MNSCIAEGRVLDESHRWGGFLTHDDGLPIVVKEETDDISKSVPISNAIISCTAHV